MLNGRPVRVLLIDLENRKIAVEEREDLNPWLGGVGIATCLLKEHLLPGEDPFHPAQPVVLAIGPMSTVYPVVTKAVAMFKSPLTGDLGESYAGLRLAMSMRFAGYDAIVLKGQAAAPAYLTITPRQVQFNDARGLWGLSNEESGRILRQLSPGSGHRSTLRIGRAGEKQVAFAGVVVDTYRHFGRLGLGAVLGSKKVKALVIHGDLNIPVANSARYNRVYEKIYKQLVDTDIMEKYHGLGTTGNVNPLNTLGALPVRNLQASSYPEAVNLSGETFARETLIRKISCSGCPVGCIHIGLHRQQFGAEDEHEYESLSVSYDHELVYALGTMLGLTDHRLVYPLIEKVEQLGLDAISAGVALAWATEAQQRGLISPERELLVSLAFGQVGPYLTALDYIVSQPTEFYQALSRGTWAAAEHYGGTAFACVLGKNEAAGYHTGYANIIGQAFGARHSHLDNAGYAIDQELLKKSPETTPEEIINMIIQEEEVRNTLNCLVICLFARKVYQLPLVAEALDALGFSWTAEELLLLGQKIYREKMALKKFMGFQPEKVVIPARFLETKAIQRQLSAEKLEQLRRLMVEKLSAL
ncbi:MAG: aldehyde:ferredoxin oxidoreductase [Syntrophomonadaceae bacterium]|nr:aldehyde:ferredoxin oxidoreductase [Syntrophomonadaceae bacterium]